MPKLDTVFYEWEELNARITSGDAIELLFKMKLDFPPKNSLKINSDSRINSLA